MEKLNLNIPEVEIFYDKERAYVKVNFTPAANKVTPEEGFVITKKIFENILKLKPKYLLLDHQSLTFPYTNEFRTKATKEISPMVAAAGSIEKIAYVMSKDIITKIGLELMQEDLERVAPNTPYKRGFFYETEQAELWLFS